MNIGIVGPGRLGRSLASLLSARGMAVDLVGRGALPRGGVVLLAVPDQEIARAAEQINAGPIVLHCSGAVDHEVLRPHRPAGSLHPLMTFPGPEVALPDLSGVPAAVSGDPEAVEVAAQIAHVLGLRPVFVPGDRRLYHAAAVMAGNFATVLLAEAGAVLAAAGVDPQLAPSLLAPLALQSLRNAQGAPARALTGPVARGDGATIERHRDALHAAGLLGTLAVYDALTDRARALLASKG
jgi:predicted short-subunit dehydrogenase-like oxidoreductase (DUF2520 family)